MFQPRGSLQSLVTVHKFFTVQKFIFWSSNAGAAGQASLSPSSEVSSMTSSLLSPLPYSLSLNCIRLPGIFPYLYAAHLIALHENLLSSEWTILEWLLPTQQNCELQALTHSHLILTVHSLACDFKAAM